MLLHGRLDLVAQLQGPGLGDRVKILGLDLLHNCLGGSIERQIMLLLPAQLHKNNRIDLVAQELRANDTEKCPTWAVSPPRISQRASLPVEIFPLIRDAFKRTRKMPHLGCFPDENLSTSKFAR